MKKLLVIMALSATTFAFGQCGPRNATRGNYQGQPVQSYQGQPVQGYQGQQGYYQDQQVQGYYQEQPVQGYQGQGYYQGQPVQGYQGGSYYEQGGSYVNPGQAGWTNQGDYQQARRTEQQVGNQPAQSRVDSQNRANANQQQRTAGTEQQNTQNSRSAQSAGTTQAPAR